MIARTFITLSLVVSAISGASASAQENAHAVHRDSFLQRVDRGSGSGADDRGDQAAQIEEESEHGLSTINEVAERVVQGGGDRVHRDTDGAQRDPTDDQSTGTAADITTAQVAAQQSRSLAEAHAANQFAAMNGTVCGWCAERLAELRTEMQKGEGHGNDEAEKEVSRRRQGAETHVPDAHGTELLHEQLRSEENAGTGDQVQREAEAALSNVKSGNYLIRCRTETGWREEVMPHRLIGPIEDCRPLYIEGSAFDIDRFSRGEVDPRLQSRCAYRSYWPRAMIDSLPTLGSGPARVVEMVSVYKRDGTRDGRVFDTVEVECRGEVCELWHPYFQCDADPFHLRLVFTLGVGR